MMQQDELPNVAWSVTIGNMDLRFTVIFLLLLSFTGCFRSAPTTFSVEERPPRIDPDYTFVTIPPNIAPLNFTIQEPGDAYRVRIEGDQGRPILLAGKTAAIPETAWRRLLEDNAGKEIRLDVFARHNGEWKKFQTVTNTVAEEPIDPWISYRLIEPGYENFREILLNQRNLENFDERPFYQNVLVKTRGQCANCHSFQDRRTSNMLFHVRAVAGGTVFIHDGKPEKRSLNVPETVGDGVYPGWHPDLNLVAFSSNETTQLFHMKSLAKVEVYDHASELILYDVDRNEVTRILNGKNEFEIYPAWSQDGNWLYYCSARLEVPTLGEEERNKWFGEHYTEFKYNLFRLPFDRKTKTFGPPERLVDAAAMDKSVTFPRPSPDGRYVMYSLADFGCFSIWHKESDLWLLDLETKETRLIDEANSPEADSFHNWSSNGRWFVFTSRRDDGSYTRLYFSYFDASGRAAKPFLLPQKDPMQNVELLKSYNVPEFTIDPIRIGAHELLDVLNTEPAKKAVFRGKP